MIAAKSLPGSRWSRGRLTTDNPANFAPRTASDALEVAYAGEPCTVVNADGSVHALPVRRWQDDADAADRELFVRSCHGDALDIGCGPGRLTVALSDAGVRTLGIDTSRQAIRQACERGANALHHNVFDPLRDSWDQVLLADGNIGIGGDPVRLLRRCAALVGLRGRVLAEIASGGGVRRHRLRLRIGGDLSEAFAWASVGVDAIASVAATAGLGVVAVESVAGRHVATLVREV